MEADNDTGAVSTYMQAGGQYGLHVLWLLIVLLPICYFVQEMVARLGIATGKGHAAMIYERFGKRRGHFSLLDLLAVNSKASRSSSGFVQGDYSLCGCEFARRRMTSQRRRGPFNPEGHAFQSAGCDCHLVAGAGMCKVTQVPLPSSLLISALPP